MSKIGVIYATVTPWFHVEMQLFYFISDAVSCQNKTPKHPKIF